MIMEVPGLGRLSIEINLLENFTLLRKKVCCSACDTRLCNGRISKSPGTNSEEGGGVKSNVMQG